MAMSEARKSAKALTKRQKKFLNYCVLVGLRQPKVDVRSGSQISPIRDRDK